MQKQNRSPVTTTNIVHFFSLLNVVAVTGQDLFQTLSEKNQLFNLKYFPTMRCLADLRTASAMLPDFVFSYFNCSTLACSDILFSGVRDSEGFNSSTYRSVLSVLLTPSPLPPSPGETATLFSGVRNLCADVSFSLCSFASSSLHMRKIYRLCLSLTYFTSHNTS